MTPTFQRKRFVGGLIDLLSAATARRRLDDADALLTAIRVLRPRLLELDFCEASIRVKQKRWHEALACLAHLPEDDPGFEPAQVLRVVCRHALAEPGWTEAAVRLRASTGHADTRQLMSTLLDDAGPRHAITEEPAVAASSHLPPMQFMRA